MNGKKQQAVVLTPEELTKTRYPIPRAALKAAGLLKHKKKELEKHLETIRAEWDRRQK